MREPRTFAALSLGCFGARGALITLIPPLLGAQSPTTGVVAGRVAVATVNGAAPLEGAAVSVVGTGLGVTTRADGHFLLERVPAGQHTLRVRLLGYRSADHAIRVRGGDTLRVDVTLRPEAQLLAPVRTDARSTDVEMFISKPNVATVALSAAAMAGVPKVESRSRAAAKWHVSALGPDNQGRGARR